MSSIPAPAVSEDKAAKSAFQQKPFCERAVHDQLQIIDSTGRAMERLANASAICNLEGGHEHVAKLAKTLVELVQQATGLKAEQPEG